MLAKLLIALGSGLLGAALALTLAPRPSLELRSDSILHNAAVRNVPINVCDGSHDIKVSGLTVITDGAGWSDVIKHGCP